MLLVKCVACGCSNGLDGQFCRQCGKQLPESELLQGRMDLESLVLDGHRLLTQGRDGEALLMAGSALEADAKSKSALGLYGDVLEKQGRYPEAVDAYEQLVSIDPTFPGARIRLEEVKSQLDSANSRKSRFRPTWPTLWYGVGASIMLACVGTALVLGNQRPESVALNTKTDLGVRNAWVTPPPVPVGAATSPNTIDPGNSVTALAPATNPQTTQIQSNITNVPPHIAKGEVRPIDPTKPLIDPGTRAPTATTSGNTNTPSPTVDANKGSTLGSPDVGSVGTATPPAPQGYVDIKLHPQPGALTSQPAADAGDSSPQQVEALIRVARERYASGNYEQAASAYEKAIKAGASKGSSNQRLAQCYEKLSMKPEAIAAYKRAKSAYEAEEAAKAEPRIERAIASCQKAIEVLQDES